MSLGDSLTIASSTPILVAVFARIFLGEKCGVVTVIASIFTIIGVVGETNIENCTYEFLSDLLSIYVGVSRPPLLTGASSFDSDTLIGSGLALGCMILAAISYTVLRYIRKVHYSVTTLMFGVWGTFENLFLAILFSAMNVPNTLGEWGLVAALASFTFFGQCAIILAMKVNKILYIDSFCVV